LSSASLFGLMAYAAKHVSARVHGAQIGLVRAVIGTLTVLLRALVGRPLHVVRWDLMLLRGLLGGLAVLSYFISIGNLPVGTATLLTYTSPVFSAIFSWLFLAERLRVSTVVALVVAGAGVTLVIFGQGQVLGGAYGWLALALVAGVLSGAAVTTIRAARRTDGEWEIFGVFSLVTIVCAAPLSWARWTTPNLVEWGLLLFVGVVSAGAQLLMTHALLVIDAPTGGIVSQLTVVISIALGHFLDGESFPPLSAAGALLTLVGVTWAARVATRHEI
jgi:drug/metabolite transporter (DMT)-like permease